VKLTPEQQAIVNHNEGPARVFAVAGAGKTTAMVHRIYRLVQEGIFAPNRILASSFSRGTVTSLESALSQWTACRDVRTQTLHSLGYGVIRKAWDCGYLAKPQSTLAPDKVDGHLYNQALREARQQNLSFKDELETLDQEDFLAYVSNCKGRLHYADLSRVTFAPAGPHRQIAQPAEPPFEEKLSWYLDLYCLFEDIRHRQGWISFDDMLMSGWQLLVQHPDLLSDLQDQFDCIIVDEFQDVNRAQFGILDLLGKPHRNYMVIGDDDQTIYEWRGAEVRFMLQAFDRYHPTNYQITDNFRCQASQVALANAVIRHNRNRYPKQLSLTQGFGGCTRIHQATNLEQLGQRVVNQVKASLAVGIAPADIAILVRVYAQTPYIEQSLIQANIPYGGSDLVPFYRRPEILDFLAFAQLAKLEVKRFTEPRITETWQEAWSRVKRSPPIRYLSQGFKEQIQERVAAGQASLTQVLLSLEPDIPQERTARSVSALAKWLAIAPQIPSVKTALEQLDACINYREHLKQRGGFKETGLGKVAGVEAIIHYANQQGTLLAFLEHLEQLQAQVVQARQTPHHCVRLTTIHQSKGLEWPVVIIPHCNQGTLPFGENLTSEELEEERRLLYVAITRAQKELHLYTLKPHPLSQFLQEARVAETLQRTEQLHQHLQSDPQTWQAGDVAKVVKGVASLGFDRYFRQWWTVAPETQAAIAHTIQRCLRAAQQQQILHHLGLEEEHLEPWQAIAPLPDAGTSLLDFPGLESFRNRAQPSATLASRDRSASRASSLLGNLRRQERVQHEKFGSGVVMAVEIQKVNSEEIITVNFEHAGTKRILITEKFCTLQRL